MSRENASKRKRVTDTKMYKILIVVFLFVNVSFSGPIQFAELADLTDNLRSEAQLFFESILPRGMQNHVKYSVPIRQLKKESSTTTRNFNQLSVITFGCDALNPIRLSL